MALFNKLFSSRKSNLCKSQEASVGEKVFSLTKDQIHVVLFRECDFRGRKLLFDSRLVQKVPLNTSDSESESSTTTKSRQEKYAEISNGFGYRYVKPSSDIGQLGEMIFGSVAMSYRGTSFKIHSLKSPSRLMCSQIFPSPKQRTRTCNSAPTQTFIYNSTSSSQSFEQSIRLDDFSASSGNSINDRLSICSAMSDTALNVSTPHISIPLDVPQNSPPLLSSSTRTSVTPNTNRDSGFSGELSNNSAYSGPRSFSLSSNFYEGDEAFSCGSLYKRWLRSASASLEHSVSLLNVCSTSDDCLLKPHVRSSKLGLAIIIELCEEHERFLEQFLMEHSTLVESMVWRTRQGVEIAYTRHANFSSLMCEVTENSVQWLVDLLAGPQLNSHMWTTLAPICDKFSVSINNNNNSVTNVGYKNACNNENERTKSLKSSESCTALNNLYDSSEAFELTFFNFSKYLKSDRSYGTIKSGYDKNVIAEKCISELCELLDNIDIKHTNFFISTLVTAVLTYHLGWVATVLPPTSNDKEKVSRLGNTCNPLWGQLADLYGAIGYPTRMSHTIITGTNKADLITKILNSLTYFIRCSDSRRQYLTRLDTKVENEVVDCICRKESCIPKENYKKYIDHLRDMKIMGFGDVKNTHRFENEPKGSCDKIPENIEMHSLDHPQTSENMKSNDNVTSTLKVTKTCAKGLAEIIEKEEGSSKGSLYPNLNGLALEEDAGLTSNETNFSFKTFNSNGHTMPKSDETLLNKVKNLGICGMQFTDSNENEKFELTNATINEKVKKLCRVPSSAVLYHRKGSLEDSSEISRVSKKVTMEMQTKSVDQEEAHKSVVFVLGENEELVGLKKDEKLDNDETKSDGAASSSLNNIKAKEILKPSTSWSNLDIHDRITGSSDNKKFKSGFDRSQSAPPEDKKVDSDGRPTETNKYKYAGVKFNIRRYPQIVTNYMRSKNLELPHLSLAEKTIKLNGGDDYAWLESSNLDCQMEEVETLQTPSNASELEFTSDLVTSDTYKGSKDTQKVSIRNRVSGGASRSDGKVEKIVVNEHPLGNKKKVSESEEDLCSRTEQFKKMKVIELPQPKSREIPTEVGAVNYTSSLMRGIGERYISDMVLQGTSAPKVEWESNLRKDLSLAARHSLLDQPINESIAIVANTDTWEVQLLSSHTYVVDRGCTGVRVGMSQLVANMLESLLHMWKLRTPPEYCVMHIEQRLQEFCALSKAVAELLLATEFCSIDLLTSVLQLEVNDIPLLMAVASTHSPQVMQKYGISFQ